MRELAAGLLLMAAMFQLSDGVQVGAAGALRGFKDTADADGLCMFSYWVVGFPLAYYFGVYQGGGPRLRVGRADRRVDGQCGVARRALSVCDRGASLRGQLPGP